MPDRIQFHFDENVDHRVCRALQRHGINVTTAVSANLRTATDKQHIGFALQENRVIVTHDDDFFTPDQSEQKPSWHYLLPQNKIFRW